MPDLVWKAVYNDGECLWECNPDGTYHSYHDIDRNRLTAFLVYRPADLNNPIIKIDLKPDYRLIWRKRRFQRSTETSPYATIYLIGWQTTVESVNGPRNIQSILYLYPSGNIELSDNKNDIDLYSEEI